MKAANATEAKTEKPVVQPEAQTEAQVKDAGVNTQQQGRSETSFS